MKKVAILQSNYIPWKGYFDMIAAVDEFIFTDMNIKLSWFDYSGYLKHPNSGVSSLMASRFSTCYSTAV